LILRKISKSDATRCQILRLKCTKFDFRCGSAPNPAGELTSFPQAPSCILRGLLLREGRGTVGEEKGEVREGEAMEEEGREGEGPSPQIFWPRPPLHPIRIDCVVSAACCGGGGGHFR